MGLRLKKTDRGFLRADFEDLYGSQCSIQESSISCAGGAIWLGVHEGSPHYDERRSSRMHLDRRQVRTLLPLLERFVETGLLRKECPARRRPS